MFLKNIFMLGLTLFITVSCGEDDLISTIGGGDNSTLPGLSSLIENPTGQFIVDAESLEKLDTGLSHPFIGANESCAHQGAHLHFNAEESTYYVNVYSPVDAIVERVSKCFDLGNGHDKYDVSLKIATLDGKTVSLGLSLEPMDPAGVHCDENPNYYEDYIDVSEGYSIKKGDRIGRLIVLPENDGNHIHFHIQYNDNHLCPNIFNSDIVSNVTAAWATNSCPSELSPNPNLVGEFGNTFCYQPTEAENITGLD